MYLRSFKSIRMKKFLGYTFALLVAFVVIFFFWGSSANENANQYEVISNSSPSATAKTPDNDTFSLVTYNIGYLSGMTNNKAVDRSKKMFDNNLNAAVQLFSSIRPDFMALQEIDFDADRSFNVNQMEELSTQVPFQYSAKAVNWDKKYVPFPYLPVSQQFGKVVSGQSVLSQYEIIENSITTLVKPEDNPFYYNAFYLDRLAQTVKINIGTKTLVIINVHLEAFKPKTRDIQIKTVLDLFHQYAKDFPVILTGDFNSTPPGASNPWQDDHVIETILKDPGIEMAIGMDENAANESNYYTFNSENPDRRIDYFFYHPKFIEVINARVLVEANQISDHLPMYMKFVLK